MWNTKVHAAFLVLLMMGVLSLAYSLSTSTVAISSTGKISPDYTVNAASGSPTDIENAINNVISHGGGTVCIPAGDWRVDQKPVGAYGYGGAIPIDLETLPSGAWLNITGEYSNTTVKTQNGQILKNVPNVILRSYTDVDHIASYQSGADTSYSNSGNNLTSTIATFGIVGSRIDTEYPSDKNGVLGSTRHIRISGLTILGDVQWDGNVSSYGNLGIDLEFVDGFLVDHCAIDSQASANVNSAYSKGVISHCIITALYHLTQGQGSNSNVWDYGVGVYGNCQFYGNGLGTPTWIQNISQVIGKYDWQGISLKYTYPVSPWSSTYAVATTSDISFTAGPVYIENSIFNYTRHATSSSQFAYYVFRYNIIYNGLAGMPMLDTHGGNQLNIAEAEYSTRGAEIYNNTIIGYDSGNPNAGGQYGLDVTGGSALIFNNKIENVAQGIEVANRGYDSSDPNDPAYIHNTWIWNNVFINVGMSKLDLITGQGITPGIDLFYDSCGGTVTPTTPAPPPPGYTPYT